MMYGCEGKSCFNCGSVEVYHKCNDCDFWFCDECLESGLCPDCRKPCSERTPEEQRCVAIMAGNDNAVNWLTGKERK